MAPKKILIVEDSKMQMSIAIGLAKQYGYGFNLVSTFDAANKMLSKRDYDGVITDKGFSVKNNVVGGVDQGYNVAILCRNFKVPCVICTGEEMDEMWQYTKEDAKNIGVPIFGNKDWKAAFKKLNSLMNK